jgi:hypothetical protein
MITKQRNKLDLPHPVVPDIKRFEPNGNLNDKLLHNVTGEDIDGVFNVKESTTNAYLSLSSS